MTNAFTDITDVNATSDEDDMFGGSDGPLFYSLPQSVQDGLTDHFMALAMAESAPDAMYADRLAA